MRIVVGITGASGSAFGVEFLRRCPEEKFLILTKWGRHVLREETGLTSQLLAEHVKRLFPDEPMLRNKYYYDSPPEFVVTARRGAELVGFRIIVRRITQAGERSIRTAGIGIAVDPAHQRSGVGTRLTERTLAHLSELGDELVIAFMLSRAAEGLLLSHGFARLRTRITYIERETGKLAEEAMPCYARALDGEALLQEIEARGSLHLGMGTW